MIYIITFIIFVLAEIGLIFLMQRLNEMAAAEREKSLTVDNHQINNKQEML